MRAGGPGRSTPSRAEPFLLESVRRRAVRRAVREPPLRQRHDGRTRSARLFLGLVLGGGIVLSAPAAAFTWGNLVITHDGAVREYRTDGSLVNTIPVPFPPGPRGADDPLHGLAFDSDARLAVYNGAAQPFLSVYEAANGTWTHASLPGWTTFTAAGHGGLVTRGRDVYVTDFSTLGGPERGIVEFDGDAGWAGLRFADLFDTADLAIGPDGRVHSLLAFSSVVYVFDPVTKQGVGSVTLEGSVGAIAVTPDGGYLGVSGNGLLRRFTPEGVSFDTLDTAIPGLVDIAVSAEGAIAIGTVLGEVVLVDAAMTAATTFLVGGGTANVAWVPFHATTPATRQSWGRLKERYRR